ncbi:MAG TPA: Tn3 family transposase, partial [Chloroflexota bacterium]
VAPSKIADFAGEAAAADVGVMQDMAGGKRIALLVCLVQTARVRTRDDVADMFCKRMAATSVQHAKTALAELQERHKALSEYLIASYKDVLEALAAPGEGPGTEEAAGRLARSAVAAAGGFGAQLADIEAVSAYHGDNAVPLVERFYRPNRSAMLQLVRTLDLQATSADRSVLEALDHVVAHAHLTRDHIPDHRNGRAIDTSFASEQWQRVIRARNHPGQLVRRHFEACVFVYLMEELRSGDVAVRGSAAYANWQDNLLPWEACTPLLGEFCAEVELPADAPGFIAALRTRLTEGAAAVDAGYPDNADLVIDAATGVPTLKRRRGQERRPAALALEEAIKERLPERSLLEILARTAYWLGWWRRFGPASGADPKLADPLLRYVLCTFTFGCNLGPYQAARHMAGVSAHELSATANRHVTVAKLNQAITDVINGFARLDLPKAWGDGSAVAADGTQVDTFIDNLLAEIHIRYGGHGGIAYHHVADTYIALFSHFIPCGVWEAVYIIEGLLQNKSDVQPDTIHADTQGQSFPVFGL